MREELLRYRPLVGDFDGFMASCRAPLPTCFRVTDGRFPGPLTSGDEHQGAVLDALLEDGIRAEPLDWIAGGYRCVPGHDGFGESLLYRSGAIQVQEAASMLPVLLLDPRSGERVLDLCAAPGNKTAQIAAKVGITGSVVACDSSASRLGILTSMAERLGLLNVSVHRADGRSTAWATGDFDAVLVDVPCSCEGTVRKDGRAADRSSDRPYLIRLQGALLRSAIGACRPGGRIVYATCTFAPEENEAIVDAALRESDVDLEPVSVPGLTLAPGVREWQGARFHQTLDRAVRLWPHAHDGGGFFAAVLRKRGTPAGAAQPDADNEWLAPGAPELALSPILNHFGISLSALGQWRFRVTPKYVETRSAFHAPQTTLPAFYSGIRVAKRKMRTPLLTTAGALLLARHATRQRIEISRAAARRYMNRMSLTLDSLAGLARGPVIIVSAGIPLGHAFHEGDGLLRSAYPKNWAGLHPPRLPL